MAVIVFVCIFQNASTQIAFNVNFDGNEMRHDLPISSFIDKKKPEQMYSKKLNK